eukprot:5753085-Alexandrium_andersonii.AAC.1
MCIRDRRPPPPRRGRARARLWRCGLRGEGPGADEHQPLLVPEVRGAHAPMREQSEARLRLLQGWPRGHELPRRPRGSRGGARAT